MAVRKNYFEGWTEADLVIELRKCQEDMAAGASLVTSNSEGNGFGLRSEVSIQERFERIRYALSILNPTTYPPRQTVDRTQFTVTQS